MVYAIICGLFCGQFLLLLELKKERFLWEDMEKI